MIFGTGPNRPVQGVLFRPMLVANWDSSTFQIGILNEGEGKKERKRKRDEGRERGDYAIGGPAVARRGCRRAIEASASLYRPIGLYLIKRDRERGERGY